jgi:ribose/xylose/arabinose/galactoside ABC-type transport system permease subunit
LFYFLFLVKNMNKMFNTNKIKALRLSSTAIIASITRIKQRTRDLERYVGRLETLLALILLVVVISLLTPVFLTLQNQMNVLLHVSVIGIVAVGMTFIIIMAGIDLSVGSVLALASVIAASFLKLGVPGVVGILIGLGVGALCGLFNGLVIAKGKTPPFVATLGMMGIARGLALVIAGGRSIYGFPRDFLVLGQARIGGQLPLPALVFLLVAALGHFLLFHTRLGQYTLTIGDNEQAARVTGIPIDRIKLTVYMISGTLAALGGLIFASRLNAAEPTAGIGYELDAIAAVVIGGTSLFGGQGSILGTLIGVLLVGVLRNGLNLLAVSPYYQQVAIGLALIGAVLLDRFRGVRQER